MKMTKEIYFLCFKGHLDIAVNTRMPELEFSWEGTDDSRPVCGRVKIEFPTMFEGEGIIYIHNGESSVLNG